MDDIANDSTGRLLRPRPLRDNPRRRGRPTNSPAPHRPARSATAQAGVDYDLIDPLKVAAQRAARGDRRPPRARTASARSTASRGESAYVVDVGPFYLASIVECLGSKALVADEMAALTGRSYYAGIAQDTIAMAVNDLDHRRRHAAGRAGLLGRRRLRLVRRRASARRRSSTAGSAPATPAASPGAAARRRRWPASSRAAASTSPRRAPASSTRRRACRSATQLGAGDAIVLLASSGIHANGLSLARKLAERLPQGYLTPLDARRRRYGEALLAPDRALFAGDRGAAPRRHHAALLRQHHRPRLAQAAAPPGAAQLPHRHAAAGAAGAALHPAARRSTTTREAYGTLNMGAGFALFVAADRRRAPRSRSRVRRASTPGSPGRVEAGPEAAAHRAARHRVRRRRPAAALRRPRRPRLQSP